MINWVLYGDPVTHRKEGRLIRRRAGRTTGRHTGSEGGSTDDGEGDGRRRRFIALAEILSERQQFVHPVARGPAQGGKGREWGCQSRLARGCMPQRTRRREERRHREEVAPRNPFRRSNASGRPSKSSRPSFRPRPPVQAARDFGPRAAEPRDGSGGHCIAGPTWSPPRARV